MKIKYELEASDFASEEELKHLLEEAKKPEGAKPEELSNLVEVAMEKGKPTIRKLAINFAEELSDLITDVTTEAATEIIMSRMRKMLENRG